MGRQDRISGRWVFLGLVIAGFAAAFLPQAGKAQDAPFDFNGLAAKGATLARQDPMAERMRSLLPDDNARRGFDFGLAAAEGQTLPGPGKQKIHDSLRPAEREGYAMAVIYSLARNQLAAEQAGVGHENGPVTGRNNEALTADAVKAHNKVRKEATPVPDPELSPMNWSEAVATVAQGWADRCQFMHNPQRGSLGENLYATTGKSSISTAVAQWAGESVAYDYGDNICSTGDNLTTCSHYTQIVWRSSLELGCGMKNCETSSPVGGSGAWKLWVCNYSPPGNMAGERPTDPADNWSAVHEPQPNV